MKNYAIIAACGLLAACGSDREGTIDTEDGEVAYTVDDNGEAVDATFTGPNGETMQVRSGANANVALPSGFTLYPGATVVTSQVITAADGEGAIVVMTTGDSQDDVMAHYRREAEAAGVELSGEVDTGQVRVLGGEGPDGTAFSLSAIQGEDGQTQIQLSVGRGNQ